MKDKFVVVGAWGVKTLVNNVLRNSYDNQTGSIFSHRNLAVNAVKRTIRYAKKIGQGNNDNWVDLTIKRLRA